MVDTVTTQTIYDGPGEVVMRFTNISDGTGEAAVTKVDVSALNVPSDEVVINRIAYATNGMGLDILWDATADTLAWHVPPDVAGTIDFTDRGRHNGLINPGDAGATGDLNFSTVGHAAGDRYTVTLYLRKKST